MHGCDNLANFMVYSKVYSPCWYLQKMPPEVIYKKGVLKNFAKFTGKHLYQSLCFNKIADLMPATLLKKRIWHRCVFVSFANFYEPLFIQNTSDGGFCILPNKKI